jgi:superfamily I DNA/RNA helicase
LLAEGVSKRNIVILSPYKMTNENSCLCGVEIPPEIGEIRENEFNVLDSDKFIRFYTAQAFKGLEAQVVIYLDIEGFKSNDERMLNYVAMSRARTLLEVFYDQSLEKDRQEMMINAATMQSV